MKKLHKSKILFLILAILMVFLIIGVMVGVYLFNFYQTAPSDDSTLQSFTVTQGESAAEIGKRLEQEGFIRYELMFRFFVKKEEIILQAGEYEIPKNLDVLSLARELTLGTFNTQITIIEGWRREEIADYLMTTELFNITQAHVAVGEEIKKKNLRLAIINKIKEGYFFPDTYVFSEDTTLPELIQIAGENFNSKTNQEMISKFEKQGLILDEAVILASIVERETNTPESRPIVAGILLKRFQNDWLLEADATVQYAMADRDCVDVIECTWWPEEIYAEDLEIDSFFNTRKNVGLPPEAICNPSLSSLQAVAEPEETKYWYYLTGKDGKMYYATTLEEHNQNIANYL